MSKRDRIGLAYIIVTVALGIGCIVYAAQGTAPRMALGVW